MRKVAIFVEGQTEQIFVREFIIRTFNPAEISYTCLKLYQEKFQSVPYTYKSPSSKLHFMIVDAGNDVKVLSAIRDREINLFQKGFERVFGLRDVYSEEYIKRANEKIDFDVIRQIVEGSIKTVNTMTNGANIELFFAIMEIEAWFLSLYRLFEKIDNELTYQYIEEALGFNLEKVDPQIEFVKPSEVLGDIMKLIGK